jgi:hypothetical protein
LGDAVHSPVLVLAWTCLTLVMALAARSLGPRLLPVVVERMGS